MERPKKNPRRGGWRQAMARVVSLAIDSGLSPAALPFAKRLKTYLRGTPASARFPMNTSILEGVNNCIKVINAWPTTSVTLLTSSSKSRTPSPERRDEP